jgi:hypothetical protein
LFAALTFGAIWFQAVKTADAAQAAQKSVTAALRAIEITMSKERARIRVDSVDLRLLANSISAHNAHGESDTVRFRIYCAGATDAFVAESYADIWQGDRPTSPSRNRANLPIELPKVIKPDGEDIWKNEPIDWLTDDLAQSSIPTGAKKTFFIHFKAVIRYADVFQANARWEMESKYVWEVTYHGSETGGWRSWTIHDQHDKEKETDYTS